MGMIQCLKLVTNRRCMSSSQQIILGGQPLPIDLGAVIGTNQREVGLAPVQFDFIYAHIHFACRCDRQDKDDGGGAVFKLVGDVGPQPFTAESAAARNAVQTIIDGANRHLGLIFRLADGRVLVGTELRLAIPVTATDLVSTVVKFMLPILPYTSLLSEVIRPPLQEGKPGESPVRPGWRTR